MVNSRRFPFAALVLGGLSAVVLAAPSLAETVTAGEAQRVLAAMPDVVSARPTGLQYAVAPPCGPCAPPCAPPCPDPCANPCWDRCPHYHVSIGMWAWGREGTMGDEGLSFDVDEDWTDSLENPEDLEFALDARIRGEWERWSATVMVDGGALESDVEDGVIDADSELSVWILQGQVGYGLFGGRLGCSPCAPVGCVEVYAGARVWWVNQDIDIDPVTAAPFSVDSEESWIDPIVGLRGELHLGDHWSLVAEGDVGGFGVGSDFSWHALGAINYHFSKCFSIGVGWKIIDVDYEDDDFIWDMQLSGPFIGITFSN